MFLNTVYKRLTRSRWELGLIRDGLDGVFLHDKIEFDWITNPFRDRWFADPFILDITDDYIYILAEEVRFSHPIGRIAKLFINRNTLVIERFVILLESPTHLSFPCILRKDKKVYVYPESAASEHLDLYEYDDINERLVFCQTLCNDVVWDSVITDFWGEELLFTANKNDHYLDIYKRDSESSLFVQYQTHYSPLKNCRMAGQFFKYHDLYFCPQQDCEITYGGSVNINLVNRSETGFSFSTTKKISSPHKKWKEALHTFNEYHGWVVVDVQGFDYPLVVKALRLLSHFIKNGSRLFKGIIK